VGASESGKKDNPYRGKGADLMDVIKALNALKLMKDIAKDFLSEPRYLQFKSRIEKLAESPDAFYQVILATRQAVEIGDDELRGQAFMKELKPGVTMVAAEVVLRCKKDKPELFLKYLEAVKN